MQTPTEATQEPRVSGAAAIFAPTLNAIFAPSKAFATLKERPTLAWWILLWIVVILIAVSFLNLEVTKQFMRVGFVESMARPDNQMDVEQARNVLETMDKWAPVFNIGQNLMLVLLVGIISVAVWAGSSMMGGSARFANAFAVSTVAAVVHPMLAGLYMTLAWQLDPPQIRRMADIPAAVPTLGLDLLIGSESMSMMTRTFLMRVDLFNLWWVVLIAMGAQALLRLGRVGAIGLALTLWLITSGIGAALSGLNG